MEARLPVDCDFRVLERVFMGAVVCDMVTVLDSCCLRVRASIEGRENKEWGKGLSRVYHVSGGYEERV